MKVAYLLGGLNRGGTETLLLDVFRKSRVAEYEFIGVHRKGGLYEEAFYETAPKMYCIGMKGRKMVSYLKQLRKVLKDEQVDIVHAQQTLDCLLAKMAIWHSSMQLMITFHGFDYGTSRWGRMQTRLAIRLADKAVFVSRYEQAYYESKYPGLKGKGVTVYNGVDFSKIDAAMAKKDAAFPEDRIKLMMVGNFITGRSQEIVAQAVKVLKEQGSEDFELYFVGKRVENEGWRYDRCEQYCKEHRLENVHFLGGRGDVPELLKTMDGFVYSTDHDTFGIAVVEAMAAGLPIVVNDWAVMEEVCEGAPAVWMYRTRDVEDCARQIDALLQELKTNKENMRARCEAQAKWVRERYSIENHIKQLEEVYVRNIR